MALSSNQFKITPVQGLMDLIAFGSVETMQVASTQATPLIPGQAVKIVDSSDGLPKVIALAANTDAADGFVAYNVRKPSFEANAPVEISRFGSFMWMTANAAIARNAAVEVVIASNTVITGAGVNPMIGKAYDKAVAQGDLIRVEIMTPFIVQPGA